MAMSENKQAALRAIAALMGEAAATGEAARFIEAGKLAQMDAAVARIGDEPRVRDFDNGAFADPNIQQAGQWGNVYQGIVQPAFGGFGAIGGNDHQALARNKLLTQDVVIAAAADAVRSAAANQESQELKTLCDLLLSPSLKRDQLDVIKERIDYLVKAIGARNAQQKPATGPMDPPEHPRGHPPGAPDPPNGEGHGVRAHGGRDAGHGAPAVARGLGQVG